MRLNNSNLDTRMWGLVYARFDLCLVKPEQLTPKETSVLRTAEQTDVRRPACELLLSGTAQSSCDRSSVEQPPGLCMIDRQAVLWMLAGMVRSFFMCLRAVSRKSLKVSSEGRDDINGCPTLSLFPTPATARITLVKGSPSLVLKLDGSNPICLG